MGALDFHFLAGIDVGSFAQFDINAGGGILHKHSDIGPGIAVRDHPAHMDRVTLGGLFGGDFAHLADGGQVRQIPGGAGTEAYQAGEKNEKSRDGQFGCLRIRCIHVPILPDDLPNGNAAIGLQGRCFGGNHENSEFEQIRPVVNHTLRLTKGYTLVVEDCGTIAVVTDAGMFAINGTTP